MKFGGIGIPELLIILVVILVIFGPKNLPKLGSALGKTVKNLREGMGGDKDVDEAFDETEEGAQATDAADEVVQEAEEVAEEEPEPAKKAATTTAKKKVVKKKAVDEAEE